LTSRRKIQTVDPIFSSKRNLPMRVLERHDGRTEENLMPSIQLILKPGAAGRRPNNKQAGKLVYHWSS
ncbi:MAG: hypothetical protein ACLPWF_17230, partial [Bryobacteraceae bacterium]